MSTFYPVLSQEIWHGSPKGLNDHQVAILKWEFARSAFGKENNLRILDKFNPPTRIKVLQTIQGRMGSEKGRVISE
jgi:hypothetical protein